MDHSEKAGAAFKLFDQHDLNGAEQIFREIVVEGDETGRGHYGLGLVALSRSDPKAARAHFHTSLQMDPRNANALYYLATIARAQGDMEKTRALLIDALAIEPAHAKAKRDLADLPPPPIPAPIDRPDPLERPHGHDVVPPIDQSGEAEDVSNDFYAMLRRSGEPVEKEIARYLDRMSDIIGTRRRHLRAYLGPLLFFTLVYAGLATWAYRTIEFKMYVPRYGSQDPAGSILLTLAGTYIFLILLIAIDVKSTRIHVDRYWLIVKTGVLREDKKSLNLFLLSRSHASTHRSLWNRLTNDGLLELEEEEPDEQPRHKKKPKHSFYGYFNRDELEEMASAVRRLCMLNPVNRDILSALGYIRNIRSGS